MKHVREWGQMFGAKDARLRGGSETDVLVLFSAKRTEHQMEQRFSCIIILIIMII
jgi:hypothetical protein